MPSLGISAKSIVNCKIFANKSYKTILKRIEFYSAGKGLLPLSLLSTVKDFARFQPNFDLFLELLVQAYMCRSVELMRAL